MKREQTADRDLRLRYAIHKHLAGREPAPDSPIGRGAVTLKPLTGRELARARLLDKKQKEFVQRERDTVKLRVAAESLIRHLNCERLSDKAGLRLDGPVERALILIKDLKASKAYTAYEFLTDPHIKAESRRQTDTKHEIHKLLSKFEFHPEVTFEPHDGIYWPLVNWRPLIRPTERNRKEIFDLVSIQNLMEVVKGGVLDRLRQCTAPDCQRWFYAHTNKKTVCSNSCRFRKYQSKQETKEKKRDYMREYFRNPKVKARLRAKALKVSRTKRSA